MSKIYWKPRYEVKLEDFQEAMGRDRPEWDTKIANYHIQAIPRTNMVLLNVKLKDIKPEIKRLQTLYPGLKIPYIHPKQFFDKRYWFELENCTKNKNINILNIYTSSISEKEFNENFFNEQAKDDEEGKYETGRTILNLQRICYDNVTKEVKEVIIFNQIDANLTEEQHKMAMKGLPQSLVNWVESLEAHLQKSKK